MKNLFIALVVMAFACSCAGTIETETEFVNQSQQTCQSTTDENPVKCRQCAQEECLQKILDCESSADCQFFKSCYAPSEEALEGDGTFCQELYPSGAEIWKRSVACSCEHCCEACGSYCGSEFGVMRDTE